MALAAIALPALSATARTDLLWWLAFLISATGMALALRLLGKRVEEPEGA